MIKRRLYLVLVFYFMANVALSQSIKIGDWRTHQNYRESIIGFDIKNKIYNITKNGVFYFNKSDNSIHKVGIKEGLSDVFPETGGYDSLNNALFIAYKDCNIDIIQDNQVISITDIKRKNIIGKKKINSFNFYENKAYISATFGIIVFDLKKMEIKDSYLEIGKNGKRLNVFATEIYKDTIYAATEEGLIKAPLKGKNLLFHKSWQNINKNYCFILEEFNDDLYACFNDSSLIMKYNTKKGWQKYIDSFKIITQIQAQHNRLIISHKNGFENIDKNNNFLHFNANNPHFVVWDGESDTTHWVISHMYGLIRLRTELAFICPNGPPSNKNWTINNFGDEMWIAAGGVTKMGISSFTPELFFTFSDNKWKPYKDYNKNLESLQLRDIVSIKESPDKSTKYLASFFKGLLELKKDNTFILYNKKNSSLEWQVNLDNVTLVYDMEFDSKDNLWITNTKAMNQLSVKKKNGTWESFNIHSNKEVRDIVIDKYDQKWIILKDNGILVLNADLSQKKHLNTLEGNGNLPDNSVNTIKIDKKGEIWIGTNSGIAVFYNPSRIFSNYNCDAEQIWVTRGTTNEGYLLDRNIITSIAIDGANNKWIGTQNGLWYVSEDGAEIIDHFTAENSPMVSNNVKSIGINGKTGEVFIGTEKGIISYKANATEGEKTKFGKVAVYPNPVRPNYEGNIAVKGLLENVNVKITDISGKLAYEGTSQGGQLVWNGYNLSGEKVNSGIYLVFIANNDGSMNYATKFAIIR